MPTYQIYVRDAGRNRIAEIDDWQRLDLVPRFNRPGSWVLDLDRSVAEDKGLDVFGRGIIVVRDGTTLLSGPIRRLERRWDASQDRLLVSGPDDLIWLTRRLALPEAPAQTYATDAYDVRTGAAETIMKEYVNLNAGPGAAGSRQVPGLTIEADAASGTTVTGRGRFQPLLQLLQELALAGGDLGYRVVQSGTDLEFRVYTPTDKTATAIFSAGLGNLLAYTYSQEAPDANYIIAGGSGEGNARTIEERGDSSSITTYGRIESFLDRRDISSASELRQAIEAELDERADRTTLSITPIDTEALAYLDGYTLGDKVTVVVGSTTIQDVVREVHLVLTPDGGEVVTPVIGTPGAQRENLRFFDGLDRADRRIRNLERR